MKQGSPWGLIYSTAGTDKFEFQLVRQHYKFPHRSNLYEGRNTTTLPMAFYKSQVWNQGRRYEFRVPEINQTVPWFYCQLIKISVPTFKNRCRVTEPTHEVLPTCHGLVSQTNNATSEARNTVFCFLKCIDNFYGHPISDNLCADYKRLWEGIKVLRKLLYCLNTLNACSWWSTWRHSVLRITRHFSYTLTEDSS